MQRRNLVFAVLIVAIGLLLLPTAGQASGASLAWSPNPYDYGPVLPGQSASHTFTLTNSSASNIASSGMLTISLSGSGVAAYSITSNTCNGVALGRGKSCSVTVQFAPTTPAQSSYPVTLIATGKKPAGGSATARLSGSAIRAPVLTLTKDNDANHNGTYTDTESVPGNATYPYTVTYKITITNSAASPATITSISDDKVGAPLRSGSTTDVDCADLIGTTIGAGATVICFYDKAFANANTSQVVNTATVMATNAAGSDTKTDTSTVNFTPTPSLDLVKSATPSLSSPPRAGDKITYSFSIRNTGNVTLTSVSLTDALLGFTNAACGAVTTLAPGASTSCSADYTVKQSDIDAGSVLNSAQACGSSPTGSNACDSDGTTTPIARSPSLDLVKSATPSLSSPPRAGDTITYSFSIRNTGNVTLTSVDLTDALAGLDHVTCGGVSTLTPGDSTTCSAIYTLTEADITAGDVHNSAAACGKPPAGANVCDVDGTDTPIAVRASPTFTTQASPSTGAAGVPSTFGDTATFTNTTATPPTGSVTFTLYSDAACKTPVVGGSGSGAINAAGTSASFSSSLSLAAGTYYWIASYAGDTSNNGFTTNCGDANETVTIGKASPTMTTVASPSTGTAGVFASYGDTANFSNTTDTPPTGSVTFTLYSDAACTATAASGFGAINAAGTSASFSSILSLAAGTYYWIASYAGDTNNNGFTTSCGDPNEELVITS